MDDHYTTINCLSQHEGKEVTLAGWLYKGRSSGKVQFLVLRDGTGLCQCVVEKSKVPAELFEQLKHLGQESSLTVTVRADERSLGGYELAVTDVQIISPAEAFLDPTGNDAFVYALDGDGFRLYSKGINRIDEGGRFGYVRALDKNQDDIAIWLLPKRETGSIDND